jgi:hypothetical protein
VQITAPARGLAPLLAAFSGIWEGRWIGSGGSTYGTLPARLIVEKINTSSAQVVYIYGAQPGRFKAGWGRRQATVLPVGEIRFGGNGGPVLTFTMSQDRRTVAGTYQFGNATTSTITMKKVG